MDNKYRKPGFSDRELQILLLACDGLTDKEIVLELNLARGTIRTYWERMRVKHVASNRFHLLALAVDAKNLLRPAA